MLQQGTWLQFPEIVTRLSIYSPIRLQVKGKLGPPLTPFPIERVTRCFDLKMRASLLSQSHLPWNLRNADERHLYLHVSLDVQLKAPADEPAILLCA